MDKRPLVSVPTDKLLVEPCRLGGKKSGNDLDACIAQSLETFAGNVRVRIFDRAHYAHYTGIDQRVRARRRAALMVVRLERNVGSSAFRPVTSLFESDRLGMDHSVVGVRSFPNHVTITRNDNAANEWVGADESDATSREVDRPSGYGQVKVGFCDSSQFLKSDDNPVG